MGLWEKSGLISRWILQIDYFWQNAEGMDSLKTCIRCVAPVTSFKSTIKVAKQDPTQP